MCDWPAFYYIKPKGSCYLQSEEAFKVEDKIMPPKLAMPQVPKNIEIQSMDSAMTYKSTLHQRTVCAVLTRQLFDKELFYKKQQCRKQERCPIVFTKRKYRKIVTHWTSMTLQNSIEKSQMN